MQAVCLSQGQVAVQTVPIPTRPSGFALLRLRCAGICNTDLELQRGYYGFAGIPGHEFVADVVACDDARLLGQRVVGDINLACGQCEWCQRDMGRHCPTRTVLGIVRHAGAFAEYFTLPTANLHVLPDSLPDEQAVFTEPVAAACEILEQVTMPPAADVAVLGDGKLGLLIAQVLQASGKQAHLFGHHPSKLAIAERRGVRVSLAAELPSAAFQWTVDATGSAAGLAQAIRMTQPRGTVVMKSTVHEPVQLDMAPVIVNEISLVGSRCGLFPPALNLLAQGKLAVEEMVATRYPLAQAAQAFEHAARRGTLKVLLTA